MADQKSLQVVVDFDLCEANALCMEACPEVFEVDDVEVAFRLQQFLFSQRQVLKQTAVAVTLGG